MYHFGSNAGEIRQFAKGRKWLFVKSIKNCAVNNGRWGFAGNNFVMDRLSRKSFIARNTPINRSSIILDVETDRHLCLSCERSVDLTFWSIKKPAPSRN
jgi:hypothetical protein